MRKWTPRNPHYRNYLRVYQSNRRAQWVGTEHTLTLTEWYEILHNANGRCQYCGAEVGEGALTIEHMVPIMQGGSSTKENVTAICKKCNDAKNDKLPGGQKHKRAIIEVYRDYAIGEAGIMFMVYYPRLHGSQWQSSYRLFQKTVEDARATIDRLIEQGSTKVPIDNMTTL